MRLIDAYKLWSDIQMLPHNGDIISSEEVEQAIMSAETIDPESLRPQGEWVKIGADEYVCHKCHVICEYESVLECGYNYCPNCGAKMKEAQP